MQKAKILAAGLTPIQTKTIGGTSAPGLTATGSNQGTALTLVEDVNEFTTVAASTGAILPSKTSASDWLAVYNGGAHTLTVYPPSGGSINALSANAGYSLASGSFCQFWRVSSARWASQLSA